MKKLLLIVILGIVTVNCKDVSENSIHSKSGSKKEKEIESRKTEELSPGCFVYQDNQSRITLEILTTGKIITGNLSFMISGKDFNAGTFTAELHKDVILGNYIFVSEGEVSAREIAFKVQGDRLLEGFGELNNEGTAFKDVSKLNYNSEMPFIKTECNKQ